MNVQVSSSEYVGVDPVVNGNLKSQEVEGEKIAIPLFFPTVETVHILWKCGF